MRIPLNASALKEVLDFFSLVQCGPRFSEIAMLSGGRFGSPNRQVARRRKIATIAPPDSRSKQSWTYFFFRINPKPNMPAPASSIVSVDGSGIGEEMKLAE